MEKETFFRLLKKYRKGAASAEEIRFLHAYYRLLERDENPLQALDPAEREALKNDIRLRLESKLNEDSRNGGRGNTLYYIRRIAAAIILLAAVSAGIYLLVQRSSRQFGLARAAVEKSDIAPGGNKARLTLADGRSLLLEDVSNGTFASQGFTEITKSGSGMLVYNSRQANGGLPLSSDSIIYNTISTPLGGQFRVVLPDGSKVWLNSASSLRFPVAFTGSERVAELSGEAYFEVARDPDRPFKVKAGQMAVEVLGTHFNINSYDDEEALTTTLLEGSVLVSLSDQPPGKNRNGRLLRPGQQARIGKGSSIRVGQVNTEEIVAWKNGYFLFNNESLESIMRQIAKWYNVEVKYSQDPGNLHFGGMVSRSKNISSVLKIMELTGNVHFKILPAEEGKKGKILVIL